MNDNVPEDYTVLNTSDREGIMSKLDIFREAVPPKGDRGRKSLVRQLMDLWNNLPAASQRELGIVARAYKSRNAAEHALRVLGKRGFRGEALVVEYSALTGEALEKIQRLNVKGEYLLVVAPEEEPEA